MSSAPTGWLPAFPAATLHTVNDYHGFAGFPAGHARPPVGSAVNMVPNHVCAAVNLHDRLYVIRGGEIVDEWRVEASGPPPDSAARTAVTSRCCAMSAAVRPAACECRVTSGAISP